MSAGARAFPGSTLAAPATTLQVTPCQRLQERFPAVPWQRPLPRCKLSHVSGCKGASAVHRQCPLANAGTRQVSACHCVLAHADTCHVSACHCEERSDVAIRTPCSSTKRKAILPGKSVEAANLPEVVLSCQVSLRGNGLPHQCAHWFAMTCRRKRRCCVCKNVGRNDMQKVETLLRVQGRFPQWTGAALCNITFTFSPMPPTPPFTLA